MESISLPTNNSFDIYQLHNKQVFDSLLEGEFNQAVHNQQAIGLLKIDVDGYTSFKDTHGEMLTQQCLNQIGSVLSSRLKRASDSIVYMGHDEFMVILPDMDKVGALKMAEHLRLAVAELEISDVNPSQQITISLGVAHLNPTKEDSTLDLLEMADQGLKQAKLAGRNGCRLGDI